jgi:hypothetical protein
MKNHRATFLLDNAVDDGRVMPYLSPQHSNAWRRKIRQRLKCNGDNAIYLAGSNWGNPRKYPVNPGLDLDVVKSWKPMLKKLNSVGLRPIIWWYMDDSEPISSLPASVLAAYARGGTKIVDKLCGGYVIVLEGNEHMSLSKVGEIGRGIRKSTKKSIGVHTTAGFEKDPAKLRMWAALGDEWYHQYPIGLSKKKIGAMTRKVREILGRKFVAAEYNRYGVTEEARFQGWWATKHGAHSTGNGNRCFCP